jgi:ECF transporter S component (folate family)
MMMAMEIVLTRFLAVQTPIMRLSLGFAPMAMLGMLYGPWAAGVAYALADLIGITTMSTGMYFPGFTLTAFLAGATYGLLLHKRFSWWRVLAAAVIVVVLINLGLDTWWLTILTGLSGFDAYLAMVVSRLPRTVIMLTVQVGMLWLVGTKLVNAVRHLQSQFANWS